MNLDDDACVLGSCVPTVPVGALLPPTSPLAGVSNNPKPGNNSFYLEFPDFLVVAYFNQYYSQNVYATGVYKCERMAIKNVYQYSDNIKPIYLQSCYFKNNINMYTVPNNVIVNQASSGKVTTHKTWLDCITDEYLPLWGNHARLTKPNPQFDRSLRVAVVKVIFRNVSPHILHSYVF